MLVLGIDTSCDDTSLALLDNDRVVVNLSASQDEFHARFGGVVPEISARKHLEAIIPLFMHLLDKSSTTPSNIGLIAATLGPGLIGGLLVGATFGNVLAGSFGKPLVGIHHLEGHIFSPGLEAEPIPERHLALIISGGHTRLFVVDAPFTYREIGSTRDDAAGELIDKTGRLLGFPYPGGKAMDEAAVVYQGEPVDFPRPLIQSDDYDFSFSGLKTAVLYYLRDMGEGDINTGAIAKGIMTSLTDVLMAKAFRACREMKLDTLTISGGVSASGFIRDAFSKEGEKLGIDVRFPKMQYTTDNAAMIAAAGYARFKAGLVPNVPIDCKAAVALSSM
jgi:N6-L-threonylcarbamoyladenine synthase